MIIFILLWVIVISISSNTVKLFLLLCFFILPLNTFASELCQPTQPLGLVLSTEQFPKHCKIEQVSILSRAWNAGLRAGDLIAAINQQALKQAHACQQVKYSLSSLPQQAISITVRRANTTKQIDITTVNTDLMLGQSFNPNPGNIQPEFNHPQTEKKLAQLEHYLQDALLKPQSTGRLHQSLRCLSKGSTHHVLPLVRQIQNQPLSLPARSSAIKQHLLQDNTNHFSLANFLLNTNSLTYQQAGSSISKPLSLPKNCTLDDLFTELELFLQSSQHLSQQAFSNISAAQNAFFIRHYQQVSESIAQNHSLINEHDKKKSAIIAQLLAIAAQVDYQQLSLAASHWFQLAEHDWLRDLKLCLHKQAHSGIVQRNTAQGRIVIGTHGDDQYHFSPTDPPIALLIEPAGNDTYQKSASAQTPQQHLYNSAIIDLSGNDHYLSTAGSGFAFAALANTLIVDVKGNDHYTAKHWAQGSSFAGTAALYDLQGNDHYNAQSFAQAMALFGNALLVDRNGHDSYRLHHHGQALGLPYGQAVLLDQQGNDSYAMQQGLSSTYSPSSLSTESWGQGMGKGFRFILPGGLGILLDQQGNDDFIAGEFAQGGGYYYGLGLLYNADSGNDHYQGSRYNAGFAAHQAIGALIESGGNDHYQSNGPACCASAWDQSISLFSEQAGNDHYDSQNFSLAASAHNSISSFWDISGDDHFSGIGQPAIISSNQYHGGQSLSYFFSNNKKFPLHINSQKQEFTISLSAEQWQLALPSLSTIIKATTADKE